MAQIILLCVGGVVTTISAIALWRIVHLPLFGRQATGTLTGWRHTFEQKWLRSGHEIRTTYYYPVVRFETPDGSQHEAVGGLGYEAKPDWPIGRPLAVRYASANPADATLDPLTPMWVFPAVFLVSGAIVLCAAISPWLR